MEPTLDNVATEVMSDSDARTTHDAGAATGLSATGGRSQLSEHLWEAETMARRAAADAQSLRQVCVCAASIALALGAGFIVATAANLAWGAAVAHTGQVLLVASLVLLCPIYVISERALRVQPKKDFTAAFRKFLNHDVEAGQADVDWRTLVPGVNEERDRAIERYVSGTNQYRIARAFVAKEVPRGVALQAAVFLLGSVSAFLATVCDQPLWVLLRVTAFVLLVAFAIACVLMLGWNLLSWHRSPLQNCRGEE